MKWLVANDDSAFRIDGLFDDKVEVFEVTITEDIGGEIATISLKADIKNLEGTVKPTGNYDNFSYKVNQEFKGTLISGKHGTSFKFECFLYDLKYYTQAVEMKFLCCKPKFTKENVVTKYTTIDNAIQSTWQLARLDKVKTDLMNFEDPWYLYQMNETNYSFNKRLCMSYKHDTVFAYCIDGLQIIDWTQWVPGIELRDQVDVNLKIGSGFFEPKLYEQKIDYIDYNADDVEYEKDPNHHFTKMYQDVIPVNSVYKELIGNFLYNKRFLIKKRTNYMEMNYLPGWHIGDPVKIKSTQLVYKEFFITGRIVEFRKSEVKVHFTLQSIKV